MAAPGIGFKSRCGIGKQTAFASLVAPTELLPFISTDIKQTAIKASGDSLIGKAGYEDIKGITGYNAAGSLEMYADYQALDLLFALALGDPQAVASYTHVIKLVEEHIRWASLHVDKGVEDHYVTGARVNELTFHSAPDGVTVTAGIVGQKVTRGSTHNAALIALTFTLGKRMYHHQAVLRVADCADALQASDAIDVSDITINLNNALKTDERTTTSGQYISDPIRAGKRAVSMSFTIPRFTANTFFAALDNDTPLQADLIYSGPTISSKVHSMMWQFPTIKVISCSADISGPDLIPCVVECECHRNNGNTPMAAILEEMLLTIVNARSTSIWAIV